MIKHQMKFLSGQEEIEAINYFNEAAKTALNSTCLKSRCGSIIVKGNEIIGSGFNSPPKNLESQRRCGQDKQKLHAKVTDKTCCMHAEERAIIDALIKNAGKILESRLYFARLDKEGNLAKAGKPYCTICSKLALDVGISEFILWHENGICVYNTEEYNKISYQYQD